MTQEEKLAWVNLKIDSDTFRKTKEEKLALYKAKQKHREFISLNPNYTGLK